MAADRNAAGVARGELTIVPAEHGGFRVYGSNDLADYNRRLPPPLIAGSLDEVLGWLRQRLLPLRPQAEQPAA